MDHLSLFFQKVANKFIFFLSIQLFKVIINANNEPLTIHAKIESISKMKGYKWTNGKLERIIKI